MCCGSESRVSRCTKGENDLASVPDLGDPPYLRSAGVLGVAASADFATRCAEASFVACECMARRRPKIDADADEAQVELSSGRATCRTVLSRKTARFAAIRLDVSFPLEKSRNGV